MSAMVAVWMPSATSALSQKGRVRGIGQVVDSRVPRSAPRSALNTSTRAVVAHLDVAHGADARARLIESTRVGAPAASSDQILRTSPRAPFRGVPPQVPV